MKTPGEFLDKEAALPGSAPGWALVLNSNSRSHCVLLKMVSKDADNFLGCVNFKMKKMNYEKRSVGYVYLSSLTISIYDQNSL